MGAAAQEDAVAEPEYDATTVGEACARKDVRARSAMQKVLDSGEHCPAHLRGSKPVAGRHP